MTPNERSQLITAIEHIAELYPRTDISAGTIKAYTTELEDLPLLPVMAALKYLAQTSRFFPTVAEIREAVGEHANDRELIADAAWAEVQREIRRVGYNRLPTFHNGQFQELPKREFSSPLIAEAVDAIGWDVLCTSEEPTIIAAQFRKAFTNVRQRAVRRVQSGDVGTMTTALNGVRGLQELTRRD